jgi:hypothetical protein
MQIGQVGMSAGRLKSVRVWFNYKRTIWEPAAPRWLLFTGIFAGILVIGRGVLLMAQGNVSRGPFVLLVGGETVVGCVQRWKTG